jgi:hypothetical protein
MLGAGIACPAVVGYDFSGSITGRRYLLEAFIDAQLFWEIRDQMTKFEYETLKIDINAVLEKMKGITSPLYGDIYSTGVIGQYPNWSSAYKAMVHLLLSDVEELLIFSPGELHRVQESFENSVVDLSSLGPACFYHGDLGLHNVMVDRSQGYARLGQVIDFGNALFYPMYVNDAHTRLYGQFGLEPVDVQACYGISPKEQAANNRLFALEATLFRAILITRAYHSVEKRHQLWFYIYGFNIAIVAALFMTVFGASDGSGEEGWLQTASCRAQRADRSVKR